MKTKFINSIRTKTAQFKVYPTILSLLDVVIQKKEDSLKTMATKHIFMELLVDLYHRF